MNRCIEWGDGIQHQGLYLDAQNKGVGQEPIPKHFVDVVELRDVNLDLVKPPVRTVFHKRDGRAMVLEELGASRLKVRTVIVQRAVGETTKNRFRGLLRKLEKSGIPTASRR
jgi:hypothetical protein